MPRPEFSANNRKNTRKSGISKWIQGRKDRKAALAEEAAKLVSDDTAKNETALINILNGIDFMHSRLPKEVLEEKSKEGRPCGDLEFTARTVSKMLIKNPQALSLDLRKIDEKLVAIAVLFKQAIEQGDKKAAYAAKAALVRGINDIRCRVPENNPELFKAFVETNEKYLDSWITLIGIAQVADRTEQDCEEQRKLLEGKEERAQARVEELKNTILDDDEKAIIFADIRMHDSNEDRAKWTQEERDMHKMMVDSRMEAVNLQLDRLLLEQKEMDLATKNSQIETLYSKVATQKIVADPNLMNKFREEVNFMFDQIAESDAEIDETLRMMDDIEGRIQQMNTAPGATRAREVAAEQATILADEIKKQQDAYIGERGKLASEKRRNLGILSREEEELKKREAEAENQRILEELVESIQETDDEREVLYN